MLEPIFDLRSLIACVSKEWMSPWIEPLTVLSRRKHHRLWAKTPQCSQSRMDRNRVCQENGHATRRPDIHLYSSFGLIWELRNALIMEAFHRKLALPTIDTASPGSKHRRLVSGFDSNQSNSAAGDNLLFVWFCSWKRGPTFRCILLYTLLTWHVEYDIDIVNPSRNEPTEILNKG